MSDTAAKNKMDFKLLGRVLALAKPFKGIFALAAALAVILAPISILRPRIVQLMVDDYISVKDIPGLVNMAILFVGVLVLQAILNYTFIYSTNLLGQSVIRDLRVRVFNHISRVEISANPTYLIAI